MAVLKCDGLFITLIILNIIMLNVDTVFSENLRKGKEITDNELLSVQRKSFRDSLGYGYLQKKQFFSKWLRTDQGDAKILTKN